MTKELLYNIQDEDSKVEGSGIDCNLLIDVNGSLSRSVYSVESCISLYRQAESFSLVTYLKRLQK